MRRKEQVKKELAARGVLPEMQAMQAAKRLRFIAPEDLFGLSFVMHPIAVQLQKYSAERLKAEAQFLSQEFDNLHTLIGMLEEEVAMKKEELTQRHTAASSRSVTVDPPGSSRKRSSSSAYHSPPPSTAAAEDMQMTLRLYFDGASKSNPGDAGAGWVLNEARGCQSAFGWKYLGPSGTNNEAEYHGLLEGLQYVQKNYEKYTRLDIFGDSNLVVQQVQGNWKVKSQNLIPLCSRARFLVANLRKCGPLSINHVPREENSVADAVSNLAIQHKNSFIHQRCDGGVDLPFLRKFFPN